MCNPSLVRYSMKRLRSVHRVRTLNRKITIAVACCLAGIFSPARHAQSPRDTAWVVLEAGASDKRAEIRADAVGVLRLIPRDSKAVVLAEKALEDQKPEVRKAAATALGLMESKGSV